MEREEKPACIIVAFNAEVRLVQMSDLKAATSYEILHREEGDVPFVRRSYQRDSLLRATLVYSRVIYIENKPRNQWLERWFQ